MSQSCCVFIVLSSHITEKLNLLMCADSEQILKQTETDRNGPKQIHKSCVMCHMSCVMCHVSFVMCHVSCVMCHVSCVICCVSGVISHLSLVSNANSHRHRPAPC